MMIAPLDQASCVKVMSIDVRWSSPRITSTLHRASAQTAGKIAAAIRLLSQGGKA